MRSLTVEYQRFGDPTGVIRLSDRYIRIVGDTAPVEELGFELSQENLEHGMAALDYGNFERGGDPQGTRRTAELFLDDVAPYLERFLLGEALPIGGDGLCQLDVVTRALELAQLPFEVLEESRADLVVTRRIRQPWPLPEVVRDNVPKVLFAWAEPKRSARSRRGMTVPHERHRELLGRLLRDWGGLDGGAVVEVANATREKLGNTLGTGERFTHVHLLAHGVGPGGRGVQPGERIDLTRKPPPPTLLALEGDDGTLDRCAPETLATLFSSYPRPETFAIATCHSGEVAPIRSGGTLAHVLHAAGVPIVLASQLAQIGRAHV